jgi:hypothetical protein
MSFSHFPGVFQLPGGEEQDTNLSAPLLCYDSGIFRRPGPHLTNLGAAAEPGVSGDRS